MLGSYTNNESSDGGSSSKKAAVSTSIPDVKEGAERLAKELDEYLVKSTKNKHLIRGKDSKSSGSEEVVADLQLTTARKLREVRHSNYSIYKCNPINLCHGLIHYFH